MVAAVAAWAGKWVAGKVAGALISAGVSGKALALAGAAAAVGTQAALYAGSLYASQALAGGAPDPESVKGSLKQPIPPRIRGYGRRRMGGAYMLWEAKENYAYDVLAIHHGRIEAIEQVWIHDQVASFVGGGASGWVEGSPDYGGGNDDLIHIETRLGLATETAYSAIVAALGGAGIWTSSHRLDGIVSLGADYHHAKKENLTEDFPNGPPTFGITGRLSPVWDPRDGDQDPGDPNAPYDPDWGWTASSNLALQILDFCRRVDGMAMDYATEIAPALEHWKGEADICDEAVPLKAGGTEPRYWGSGYYALPGEPQEMLNQMLAACDGRLLRDEYGVWRLWVGKVREPTVHLTDEDVADYDVTADAAAFDVVNELVPAYVSEAHKWTMVEAPPWTDAGDAELRGRVLTQPFPLPHVNSRTLSRRLAKRESRRLLTPVRGALVGHLSAARALGQRWIRIDVPDLDMEGVLVELESGGRTSFARAAVDLPFFVVDPAIDEWDPDTEEDGSTGAPGRPGVDLRPAPTIDDVTPFQDAIGDALGVRLAILGEGPSRADLTWFVGWRVVGDASWSEAVHTDSLIGAPLALETGFVPAVAALEVRIAYQTGGGYMSAWSAVETLDTRPAAPPIASLNFLGGPYRVGVAAANQINGLADWTFSRSVAGYAGNADGSLEAFAAGVERITDQGLFIEPASTNLVIRSQEIDHAAWAKSNGGTGVLPTVTANAVAAPDGSMTADRVVLNQGAGTSTADFSLVTSTAFTVVNGAPYTSGLWLRADTPCSILIRHVGNATYTKVDLTTAWQRFPVTETSTGTSRNLTFGLRGMGLGSSASATIDVWGAKVEAGSALSSDIPTTTAAVTRPSEVATLALPAGDPADEIEIVHTGGIETFTRADLANPLILDLGGASGGAWVGQFIETVTVSPA